jgi:polyferredoxin
VLLVIVSAFVWGLATRIPLRVDVVRDRASLGREVPGDLIENDYVLRVMNMTEVPQTFVIDVSGLDGIRVVGNTRVTVAAAKNEEVPLQIQAPVKAGKPGSHVVYIDVASEADPGVKRHEKTTFLYPE